MAVENTVLGTCQSWHIACGVTELYISLQDQSRPPYLKGSHTLHHLIS